MPTYDLYSESTGRSYRVKSAAELSDEEIAKETERYDQMAHQAEQTKPLFNLSDTLSAAGSAYSGLTEILPASVSRLYAGAKRPDLSKQAFAAEKDYAAQVNRESTYRLLNGQSSIVGQSIREVGPSIVKLIHANPTAVKIACPLPFLVPILLFYFRKSMQPRIAFIITAVTTLCIFVGLYCFAAAMASGGWSFNRDGEPSYSSPHHYSKEFYEGLRWSVMIAGTFMSIAAHYCKDRWASVIFCVAAVLFNPLVPIHMDKGIWQVIDALAGWVFLSAPTMAWPKDWKRDGRAQSK
jgi:hypothetical protein